MGINVRIPFASRLCPDHDRACGISTPRGCSGCNHHRLRIVKKESISLRQYLLLALLPAGIFTDRRRALCLRTHANIKTRPRAAPRREPAYLMASSSSQSERVNDFLDRFVTFVAGTYRNDKCIKLLG